MRCWETERLHAREEAEMGNHHHTIITVALWQAKPPSSSFCAAIFKCKFVKKGQMGIKRREGGVRWVCGGRREG